jgi:copper(I)-binding protein
VRTWLGIFASCCSLAVAVACGTREVAPAGTPITVRDAWARTADSGAMTAVYFTLANAGEASDTLSGVTSVDAEQAAMHISTQHGGMMHMSPVTSLPVPAVDSVMFRPLGAHVMLTGVRRPLVAGDSVDLTLTFVSGRTVGVRAGVRQP